MTDKKSLPEKLPLNSIDLTECLLALIRDAAPQVFSEGKLDFVKLEATLGEYIDYNPERYGLNWAGKRDAFRNVQVPSVATLRPQFEESVNWDSTENLIIEGDNLEVLKLLQKPYHGKVKMIYIDPPFNTGNEFIYPDNFQEGLEDYLRYTGQLSDEGTAISTNRDTSGRYHSNWLNMMYPRLFLARNLLKEDGVIFVSIDDHEVHNLRLLMDEVFGEESFLGCFIWHRRQNPDSRNQDRVSSDHEYLLLYKRHQAALRGKDIDIGKYSNPDNDPRGSWFSADLTGLANKEQRPNLHYEVINPKTGIVYSPSPTRGWSCSKERFQQLIDKDQILWPRSPNGRPRLKKFLNDIENFQTGFSTMLDVGFTTEGTKRVQELFGEKLIEFPKPVSLLTTLLHQATEQEDIVLDFFAGSGTTADAVLQLNEDGGNRKFILVQLPEKTGRVEYPTIAHITRERVRRVIAKLNESDANELDFEGSSTPDRGFRAFKLDSSNFKIWQADAAPQSSDKLAEQLLLYSDNVLTDRSDEDRLFELILNSGLPLSSRVEFITVTTKQAFSLMNGLFLICLESHLSREVLRELFSPSSESQRPTPQMVICLDKAFDGDDALKTNAVLEAKSHGITFRTV